MAGFWTLLKIRLKIDFSLSALLRMGTASSGKPKKFRKYALAALLVVAFGELYVFYLLGINVLSDIMISIKQQDAFLTLVIMTMMLVIWFFGLFSVMSRLYFAKDIEFLAALPVRPVAVFSSKLASNYLFELLFTLPFLIPAFLMYGIKTGSSALFYLRSIPVILFLPVLPIMLATVVSMILMRATVLFRRRDLVATVGGFILLIGLMIGSQKFNSFMVKATQTDLTKQIASQSLDLAKFVSSAFPPALWATQSAAGGIFGTLLYYGVCAAAVYFICIGASALYYRSISGLLEQAAKKGRGKAVVVKARSSSAVLAIFKKEWKMILRIPVYALNGLTGVIIVPIILLSGGLTSGGSGASLNALLNMIRQGSGIVIPLGVAAALSLVGAINPAASTVYSREGDSMKQLLSLPVSIRTVTLGKLLFALSIGLLGMGISAVTVAIVFKIGLIDIVLGAVVALLAVLTMTELSVLIDLASPKLQWNSPTEAIKQNMNSLYAMGLSLGIMAAIGVGVFFLIQLKLPDLLVWLALSILLSAAAGVLHTLLMKLADRRDRDGFPI